MIKYKFFAATAILLAVAIGFSSCKKDDPEPEPTPVVDIRDAAVGTYNGTISTFFIQNGQLVTTVLNGTELVPEQSINATVSKDNTNANAIKLEIDGDTFYGSKIAAASNGFSFDIESQTFSGITINGYNAITLGTSSYHGAYFATENKIEVGFQAAMEDFFSELPAEDIAAIQALGINDIVLICDINKR